MREKNEEKLSVIPQRTLEQIKQELKELLIANLSLEGVTPADIADDAALFGEGEGGLELDSLDAVEVVVILQRQYGLNVKDMQKGRQIFRSINTLAPYVLENTTK
jgi:acyl carrier protein